MGTNNFKAFAAAAGANVMTQADYEALAALLTGFVSGTAQSAQLNKVWRQSSIISAVLAQFIVDLTGQDAIDDGTTTNLLANLKAAVQAQSAAVVGQARSVVMSVTAASTTATLTADEIIVGTALGGQKYLLKQFSKTVNLATTGAGGMDTGAAPTSGYVALYAIYNPTTGTSALLATNATNATQPNVYGGVSMPIGYTASALVSVWPTNSSGQLVIGLQTDRSVAIVFQLVLNSSVQQSSATALSISGVVPKNARSISGSMSVNSTSSGTLSINISGSISRVGEEGLTIVSSGGSSPYSKVAIGASQTLYYLATVTAGTPIFQIYVSAYEF